MKVFIINKSYADSILRENAKKVHQKLFYQFMKAISEKENIKDFFVLINEKHEAEAHFRFSHAVGSVYFFEFLSTVS